MNRDDFHMVLPSNSCPLIHPDNTYKEFKIDWENPINLEGEWELALLECSIFNIADKELYNQYVQYSLKDTEKHQYVFEKTNNQIEITEIFSWEINYVNYPETEYIPLTIRESSRMKPDRNGFQFSYNKGNLSMVNSARKFLIKFNSIESAKKLGYDQIYNNIYDNFKSPSSKVSDINFKEIVTLEFSEPKVFKYTKYFNDRQQVSTIEELKDFLADKWKYIFAKIEVQKNNLVLTAHPNTTHIDFTPNLHLYLGILHPIYSQVNDETIIIKAINPLSAKISSHVFIYSSLVEPIIVGDTFAPLLKTFWIEEKNMDRDAVHISINRPMYLPLSTSCINNVEFNLRYDSGNFINFNDKTKTVLTIHFRKKK